MVFFPYIKGRIAPNKLLQSIQYEIYSDNEVREWLGDYFDQMIDKHTNKISHGTPSYLTDMNKYLEEQLRRKEHYLTP